MKCFYLPGCVAPLSEEGNNRQISQMTYKPKNVLTMADFETLTLSISLNLNKICIYFYNNLVAGYFLYLIENSIPSRRPFSN